MMYLLRSWKDSLSLFLPSNFKLFFLVTVKCIVQVYKDLFKYFWWLILAVGIIDFWWLSFAIRTADYFIIHYGMYTLSIVIANSISTILLGIWLLYYFVIYLTARPSLKPKGYEYYREYGIYFIYFILLSVIAGAMRHMSKVFSSGFHTFDLVIYLSPFLTFTILFLLDSDGRFSSACKSIWRGFKMWWYNLPFCITAYTIFWLISYLLFWLVLQIFGPKSILLSPIVSALLVPIPLTFLNNFYIKRLHDQFTLYFPESIKEQ